MRIYHGWHDIPTEARAASVALGNFDGVHLGHRKVIEEAAKHGPLGIVTFEPHPRSFFSPPTAAPFRLMSTQARANRLAKLGVEHLFELPFDAKLAALTPEAFVEEVLHQGLGLKHVVVGSDFCFGKGRVGSAEDLERLCAAQGIDVTRAPLKQLGEVEISSTRIRSALSAGEPRLAAQMLGHWHRIEGEVIHGAKRGRELGFPTANMALDALHLPRAGVYAVFVDVLTGPHAGRYLGAANLGTRPMFGDNVPNLETYLLDFKGDLYGETLSVAFVDYLRDEEKFDGLPALIAQMERDCATARRLLETA